MSIVAENTILLGTMNEVVYVGYVSGRYDIIAEFLYRNHSELLTFHTECLTSFEDIVSTESFHVLHTAKINCQAPHD